MSNEPPLPPGEEPEKLVLPPPPDSPLPDDAASDDMHTLVAPYAARNNYQATMPPRPGTPIPVKRGQRQRDPAYRFLLIGMILLIIAGLFAAVSLSNTFAHLPTLFGVSQSDTPQSSAGASTQGTVDTHPSFPTPGGGHGSTQTSQPPTSGTPTILPTSAPSPTPGPTSTPAPTPTPGQSGALTVQITSYPSTASNNSTVSISVSTNQPAVTVQLLVLYNAPPYRYISSLQTTDGNGNASLPWSIHVITHAPPVTATLSVVARSQNGQQVISQAVFVQIIGTVGG